MHLALLIQRSGGMHATARSKSPPSGSIGWGICDRCLCLPLAADLSVVFQQRINFDNDASLCPYIRDPRAPLS